ncbi:MAG: hypothetical protein AAFN30_06900 [Actinomycetota bacterium]
MSAMTEGRELARRHQRPIPVEAPLDLVNLSERARSEGWTFRSALVRFAQPEPLRSAVIMEFIRRGEAALQPLQSILADGRLVELARLLDSNDGHGGDASDHGDHDALEGYQSLVPLTDDELAALPLVRAVLTLDDLGQTLAEWAPSAPAPGPVATVDDTLARLRTRFDDLSVPVESGPPGPGRGRRR